MIYRDDTIQQGIFNNPTLLQPYERSGFTPLSTC